VKFVELKVENVDNLADSASLQLLECIPYPQISQLRCRQ